MPSEKTLDKARSYYIKLTRKLPEQMPKIANFATYDFHGHYEATILKDMHHCPE